MIRSDIQLERDLISQRTKEGLVSAKARGRNGGRPGKQNEKTEIVMAIYGSDMNMKHNNTRVSMVLASFLYVMKNIVVERQKICYTLKRVIVLQGGSLPNLKLAYIDRTNKRK